MHVKKHKFLMSPMYISSEFVEYIEFSVTVTEP